MDNTTKNPPERKAEEWKVEKKKEGKCHCPVWTLGCCGSGSDMKEEKKES